MKDPGASVAAFLAAPSIPAVTFALSSPGLGGGLGSDATSIIMLSLLGYLWAFAITLFIALPLYLILRSRGMDNMATAASSGTIIGMMAVYGLLDANLLSSAGLLWAVTGAASGALFWYIRSCILKGEQQ